MELRRFMLLKGESAVQAVFLLEFVALRFCFSTSPVQVRVVKLAERYRRLSGQY